MSSKSKPAMKSRDTGEQKPCFIRCQLTIAWMSKIKKGSYKSKLNVSFNIVSGVRPLRRRRRAYAPTSNTAAVYDNHEKIHTWVSFSYMVMWLHLEALRAAGAPLLETLRNQVI